ncbi:class E sortase [Saccharothrix mutabilis subsp. capreolus]|uniref:class E sortase n=1 Tax=Saccharothrix mutabilis TaxID=33921 RepID=UPI0035ECA02E
MTGDVLVTLGLVLALFVAYEVWGKTGVIKEHQGALDRELVRAWTPPPAEPAIPRDPAAVTTSAEPPPVEDTTPPAPRRTALGRLSLPRLGLRWVLVEGVTQDLLEHAPGHYPGSAMPGELGNFAVAGHRNPGLFWDLDLVREGDFAVVETSDTWFVYRVYRIHVVAPTAVEVVAAEPGRPRAAPTKARMTLTTCNPKLNNYERLVVHAELDHSLPKASGTPRELEG